MEVLAYLSIALIIVVDTAVFISRADERQSDPDENAAWVLSAIGFYGPLAVAFWIGGPIAAALVIPFIKIVCITLFAPLVLSPFYGMMVNRRENRLTR